MVTDNGLGHPDLAVLATIGRLTGAHNGRPPTLAEIARAMGLQVSSRGNIQRQLTKLRPQYVDWGREARSIRLTPLALSLLDVRPLDGPVAPGADGSVGEVMPGANTIPVSIEVLSLIASGLTKLASDVADKKPVQAPYPEAWRRGLNRLAVECILRGVRFPSNTPQAIEWCKLSPSEWPIRFDVRPNSIDMPLLEDDQPTSLCRELAFDRDAELQASEASMKRLLDEARLNQAPDAYVRARRFIVENPVVGYEALMEAALDPDLRGVGSYIIDMYEKVPTSAEIGREVLTCGTCGWTLEIKDDALQCGDKRCALLTARFSERTGHRPYSPDLWRVRRAIRRYIVAPGRYELDTARELEKLGLLVNLWPCFDAYDLRVAFPDGTTWAVDLKDWQFPTQLARKLDRIPRPPGCEWQSGFYVVPDQRVRENQEYLAILRNVMIYSDISAVSVSELVRTAREHIQTIGGTNA